MGAYVSRKATPSSSKSAVNVPVVPIKPTVKPAIIIGVKEREEYLKRVASKKMSFIIFLCILMIILLLFFVSYKLYVYMNVLSVEIYPSTNIMGGSGVDGYDLNYLVEQAYYTSLSDSDKDIYLSLSQYDKINALKMATISQISD